MEKWLRRVISQADAAENFFRERVVQGVRELPFFQLYKVQKQMLLLEEVTALLAQQPVHCYVVGGFAYDGLKGKLTSRHADIDMALPRSDADTVSSLLRQNGFTLHAKSPFTTLARSKEGLTIDLYCWKDAGEGMLQFLTSDIVVRIPAEFLKTSQEVELLGIRYPVACNEYLVSSLPFIKNPASAKFVESLPTSVPVSFRTRREFVQLSVEATVHEFCDTPPSRRNSAEIYANPVTRQSAAKF
jgi:hypothetical protein